MKDSQLAFLDLAPPFNDFLFDRMHLFTSLAVSQLFQTTKKQFH